MTRFKIIRARLSAAPPRGMAALGCCLAAIAIPTLFRVMVDDVVAGVTFSAYYPSVLLVALMAGWRLAAAVAAGSALVANFLFMAPRYTLLNNVSDTSGTLMFVVCVAMIILVAEALRSSVHDLDAARERERHLNLELQHRVRNTLTVVQGLASQTFRGIPEASDGISKFGGRIRALAEANKILAAGHWEACALPELAERALQPFDLGGAFVLNGPRVSLPEQSCVPLVLALHELATNAVKYGSLSVPGGTVELNWTPTGERMALEWRERGGPLVGKPVRQGLGSRLLRPQTGLAAVDCEFAPDGVRCRMALDGAELREREAA